MATVLTLEEAAEFLKVHPSTIYRLLKKQTIPAFKIGSDWRFNQESLDSMDQGARRRLRSLKQLPGSGCLTRRLLKPFFSNLSVQIHSLNRR